MTVVGVLMFRGLVEVVVRRLIPSPSLYGAAESLKEEDIVARRRYWYWRSKFRRLPVYVAIVLLLLAFCQALFAFAGISAGFFHPFPGLRQIFQPNTLPQLGLVFVQLPLLFFVNFAIFFGPFLFFAVRQIRGYEPGDASWGVKIDDVRGQAEAKEEITRVITLWQSGEEFEKAGGKRERGLLFLGAPGTGKTMISKAIATNFNCPFVTIPGSGFAGMFIGMDAITVQFLAHKARKLAEKWGGQCIVFIDEIDAVGMRRQPLGAGSSGRGRADLDPRLLLLRPQRRADSTGDLVIESRAWRERLFAERAERAQRLRGRSWPAPASASAASIPASGWAAGWGAAWRSTSCSWSWTASTSRRCSASSSPTASTPSSTRSSWSRTGSGACRCGCAPRARARSRSTSSARATCRSRCSIRRSPAPAAWAATSGSVPRPRTTGSTSSTSISARSTTSPTSTPSAAATSWRGSPTDTRPSMIEQCCSMALTIAHTEGRREFGWRDIVEAMTTVETGTAQNIEYIQEETRAVAIHEAGHAAAGHVYMEKDVLSTRLSIRKRGGSLGHYQSMEKDERFSHFRSRGDGRADHDAGRDGRRARLLRRELPGRQRRRVQRHRDRRRDGRDVGDGPRPGAHRRQPRAAEDGRGRARAPRADRLDDHEPGGRRRACSVTTRSAPCSATRTSGARPRRSWARPM